MRINSVPCLENPAYPTKALEACHRKLKISFETGDVESPLCVEASKRPLKGHSKAF